ncbi:MAG TPA: hypothetical protein VGD23_05980 [Sphingomicrobium sp.]
MRRWASIILFVIGGFCVGMQVMIAFMKVPPEYPREVPPILYFSAIALLFLMPATWLSPGRRWWELGVTMLTGAAICIGSFAITITATPEEGSTGGLGPLDGYVDWGQGWTNVSVIAIAGLLMIAFEMWGRDWA